MESGLELKTRSTLHSQKLEQDELAKDVRTVGRVDCETNGRQRGVGGGVGA